jgi:hypothetical protein
MFEVLAGAYQGGHIGTDWRNRLVLVKGFNKTVLANKVRRITAIDSENATSILSKAAWGVAGAALLGPVGALAGVLGGGNKTHISYIVEMDTGEQFLVATDKKTYYKFLNMTGQPLL